MFSDETVIVSASGNLSSELGEEVVVLDIDRGMYYGLNPVASFIWGRLGEPTSVGELRAAVLEEFDIDESTCRADLDELLAGLLKAGLIEARLEAA